MAISAKRFNFLTKETNVAISDFSKITDSGILNSINNELNNLTSNISEFLNNAIQSDLLSDLKNIKNNISENELLDGITRTVKDSLSSLQDLTKLSSKDLDKFITQNLPDNPLIKSAFTQISNRCKTPHFSSGRPGKRFNPNVNCNGGKGRSTSLDCDSGQFRSLLSKLTNGQYNPSFSDRNSLLNNLLSLSKYGYGLNMCGVLGALISGLNINDLSVLNRGIGTLLGSLGKDSNILGFLDIATNVTDNLNPLLEYPKGLDEIFKNFTTPKEITEDSYKTFITGVTDSAEIFDSDFLKGINNDLSVAKFPSFNEDLDKLMSSKRIDSVISSSALDTIAADDFDFVSTAYKFSDLDFALDL